MQRKKKGKTKGVNMNKEGTTPGVMRGAFVDNINDVANARPTA